MGAESAVADALEPDQVARAVAGVSAARVANLEVGEGLGFNVEHEGL